GMLLPQIPIPVSTRYPIVYISSIVSRNDTPAPRNQPIGVRRASAIELILSVTDANVCPAPTTDGGVIVLSLTESCTRSCIELSPYMLNLQFRIWISHSGQIGRAWLRVQFTNQTVIAFLSLELRDAAIWIIDVTEDNRFGRARLRARGCDLAVSNESIFFLGIDLGFLNSLHAVSALLHHAAAANAHVRVAHHLKTRGVEILIQQKIKSPNFVRAVVRTIARANTAVVSHVVQAFSTVSCRSNRADNFAGRVLALLTRDRLKISLRIYLAAFVVSVHTQPMHLPGARYLFLADDGDVVLGDASDHAGCTAYARAQID